MLTLYITALIALLVGLAIGGYLHMWWVEVPPPAMDELTYPLPHPIIPPQPLERHMRLWGVDGSLHSTRLMHGDPPPFIVRPHGHGIPTYYDLTIVDGQAHHYTERA